jgi:hypothetical protein
VYVSEAALRAESAADSLDLVRKVRVPPFVRPSSCIQTHPNTLFPQHFRLPYVTMADPDVIASIVSYLCKPESYFITGAFRHDTRCDAEILMLNCI